MFKFFFFSKSIQGAINTSETYVLSNCQRIDTIYSKMSDDTPHYLGVMGNYLIDKSLEGTMKATLETLNLLVYASEEVITFMIDLYLGTYACLAVSAIHGTVEVATNTTEKLLSAMNSTVSTVANDLDDGLDGLSKIINKIISAASKIEDFFTDDDDDDSDPTDNVKQINLTISALRNLYIPSSINDKLEELSANTPTFDKVKNMTKQLVSEPFDQVRKEIKTINTTSLLGNKSMLYVPPLVDISNGTGICSSNKPLIKESYKFLTEGLKITTTILIVLMIVGAIAMLVPVAWNEYRLWTRLSEMQEQYLIRNPSNNLYVTSTTDDDVDTEYQNPFKEKSYGEMEQYDVIASYQYCFQSWNTRISSYVTKLVTLGRTSISPTERKRIEWVVAYITSERALCVLGIGLLALIMCIFQFILLAVLKHRINSTSGTNSLSKSLLNSSITDTMVQDLNTWGVQTNDYINYTESSMNKQIFGWIDTTTVSLNNTVTTMIDGIDDTLGDIFNGTLLYNPMKTVVMCVIENKLYAIEKGLTWVHDKAQISIPRINGTELQETLQRQVQQSSNSTTSSGLNSAMAELTQDMKKALSKILDLYHHIAMQELIISLVLIAIWAIQLPVAFLILRCEK